jgi:ABC-type sugar transport system ATPase subunit
VTAQLRFIDVGKWYEKTRVLEGLNLEVAEGELFVLLGPSGCGKSTILRMTAGLEPLSSGEIYLRDAPISRVPPENRNVAMVFQDYALYPHMTVYNNMAFGLRRHGVPREEADARIRKTARLLGIEELLDRRPHHLSGGQQQRVALGRAIVRNPVLYLMDEPLSNLDAQVRATVRAEIKELQRTLGVTTLYVTHDQIEAMTLADRMAVINQGTVQQVGPPLAIYRTPATEFVARFLASPRFNVVAGTLARDGNGLVVRTALGAFKWADAPAASLGADADVRAGLRPEDIKVSFVPTDGAALAVRLVEALGSEVLLHVTAGLPARLSPPTGDRPPGGAGGSPSGGGGDLVVRVATDAMPQRLERLWVRPAGCTVHLFDPRTGAAVAHFTSA